MNIAGLTYQGSIEEARGSEVIDIFPCRCGRTHSTDRVTATIWFRHEIRTLDCARPESFQPAPDRSPVRGWYPPADLPDDMLDAWRAAVPDHRPKERRAYFGLPDHPAPHVG